MIQVHKFGGASIAGSERMEALLPIIRSVGESAVVVVSAYGKTTNALEEVVWAIIKNNDIEVAALLEDLKEKHVVYAGELLSNQPLQDCKNKIGNIFGQIQQQIDSLKGQNSNFIYDQIVSIGELLSTTILYSFLATKNLKVKWLDARKIIQTNNQFREPKVDEQVTTVNIQKKVKPLLDEGYIVITQGFIGSTEDGWSTTLGREGSDYSGALFAAMLGADSLTIWKDVESLLNADPRKFDKTIPIPETTFHEVIEMAYYGAQVIHPKTIKPLQNQDIPLYLKCFFNSEASGTLIHNTSKKIAYPPIIVLKDNQILLEITTRDYSFFSDENLNRIYKAFHQNRIKINLTQNAAISVIFVVNNDADKVQSLIAGIDKDYKVKQMPDRKLLTIRHYNDELIRTLTEGKDIILTQKTPSTIQMVLS